MKADLFVLYSLLAIAALFAYVFVGGLVVRVFNVMPLVEHPIGDDQERATAVIVWPIVLVMVVALAIGQLGVFAYRLSQWRPRRKSTLPGARVVRP